MNGSQQPWGGRGSRPVDQAEGFSGDPRISPGLPRPIGWRVRNFDGSEAYDKAGPLDTDWVPVGGSGGPSGYIAELYLLGILDDPPTGATRNTLVGQDADIFFDQLGRLVVTDNDEFQNFGTATMARWRKRQIGPGVYSFSESTILYPDSGLPSGTAWSRRLMGRRASDETQTFSGMEELLDFHLSSIIGWPGDPSTVSSSVRQLSFNVPTRGSNSFADGGGGMLTGDSRWFLGAVAVPSTGAYPREGIALHTVGTSERANGALGADEGVGWYSQLRVSGGGSAVQAGFFSNDWIDPVFATARSRYMARTRTMEESNVGFPYDLSAILSFDGEVASARSRRNLRIHGWNDTPAEIEMGFFEANFTDDTAGSEDTTLSLFLKQAGVDVESVRWSPASTSVPSLELTAPAAAPQQPSAAPGLFTISAIIDLTAAAATYVIIPPTVARFRAVSIQWEIKTTNTVTVAPTYSVGTNAASFNNVVASVTPAAFTTQAAETAITLTVAAPVQVADMTASGLVLNVTNPATATALTARITVAYGLAPV